MNDVRPSSALGLLGRGEVPYPDPDGYFGKGTHLREVALPLTKETDFAEIARILAQGRDAAPIEAKLHNAHADGRREIPVEEVLPGFVKKKLNSQSECDGPNCFNTTLNYFDESTGLHETKDTDMVHALETRFDGLQPRDKLKTGDVVSFWASPGLIGDPRGLVHTAVFLDGQIFFHKAGKGIAEPYVFETFDEMVKHYGRYDLRVTFHRKKP